MLATICSVIALSSTEVDNLVGMFGDWRPDVILTDVNMPQLSGVDLCRRLKSSYETALDHDHAKRLLEPPGRCTDTSDAEYNGTR